MSPLPKLDHATTIAVIAAGRLGSSIAGAMLGAGYNVASISSRRAEHRDWLRSRLPGSAIVERAQVAADLATIVFITGPDSAVEDICARISWRDDQAALHCAGILPVSALSSAAASGASTGGFHPFQTFPSPGVRDNLQGVSFGIEAGDPDLLGWLKTLATDLGGSPIEIEPGQRAAYHASAVMACGLIAGLVGLAAEMWAPLGVGRDDALKRVIPMVRSTVEALDKQGIPSAITGPFVRGDVATVESHLSATSSSSPATGRAYAALALASLHIAREQGGLSDADYERIRSLLSSAIQQ